jgi:RNA polymerase-binding transcription factor
MTTTQLRSAQEALRSKLTEVQFALAPRDSIAVEQMPDPVDMTQQESDREMTAWAFDHQARLAQEIRAAMDRIADGTYGVCLSCEAEISSKRLSVMPWAELCIHCQEAADTHSSSRPAPLPVGHLLEAA